MSAIKKGDLVIVIRPSNCCGTRVSLGKIFAVSGILQRARFRCGVCLAVYPEDVALTGGLIQGIPEAFAISRLKRLDPDTLNDETLIKEEISA